MAWAEKKKLAHNGTSEKERCLTEIIQIKPQLECCGQFLTPYLRKDVSALEAAQKRFSLLVPGIEEPSFEETVTKLNLYLFDYRRMRDYHVEALGEGNLRNCTTGVAGELSRYKIEFSCFGDYTRITSRSSLAYGRAPVQQSNSKEFPRNNVKATSLLVKQDAAIGNHIEDKTRLLPFSHSRWYSRLCSDGSICCCDLHRNHSSAFGVLVNFLTIMVLSGGKCGLFEMCLLLSGGHGGGRSTGHYH
ncbi:uncharacterized protein LOC132207334 [Stegostoma tigrinum]|uniref:uncharacterized protein LOC132207334 n=1 Tax=Stegostoma tigrinum TaxID=3053191 RepID=UPI00286FFEF3|nr:uncharacterized protein LOC132207334 [Stegostoma tigrinum]